MDIVVLKFGGSSLADNLKLNIVANKIIEFHQEGKKVVVVVSAQGKTTDGLIKEALELSAIPNDREMDVLLSSGEQISMSKLSILLNRMGYDAISLTGWQAGIYTNEKNQDAKIQNIDTSRIEKELEKNKIVIVAGFQGINEDADITTLGRGGSDTTAVALASELKAEHCYIFSDVDGVYTADPNRVKLAKKNETLSYTEMLEMSGEGAKVLHHRCVGIAQRFNIPIVSKSTFNNNDGTIIQEKIEGSIIKGLVKIDNLLLVNLKKENYNKSNLNYLYNYLLENNIAISDIYNNSSNNNLNMQLIIKKDILNKFLSLIDSKFSELNIAYSEISKISIIGYGLNNDEKIIKNIFGIIKDNDLEIFNVKIEDSKIVVLFNNVINDDILNIFHNKLLD